MDKETTTELETTEEQNFPPLIRRFQSLIIDQLFIISCMILFSQLLDYTDEEKTGALRGVLFFGLFLIYEPFCMAFGCTIGNYLSGIRVRKFGEEDKRISLFNSYIRFVVKLLLGIISFFTVTADEWKRAIHDRAADSIVVYKKKIKT